MNFRILILLFLGAWTVNSCGTKAKVEQQKPASVFIKKVQTEQIYDILNYPARVRARVNATVLSESDGIITQVFVTLGKKVRLQQTLMVLSHTDPVYQYAPVQILAPIQGIVSSIDVTVGSHVVQGQKLAAVINPSQLEIQVEIPAQDLAMIKKGMIGEFKIPGQEALHKDEETSASKQRFLNRKESSIYKGPLDPRIHAGDGAGPSVQVLGVSPFVDPSTGTALAQLDIVSKGHLILSPGIQGQVTFKVNSHQGFLIPDSSIIYKGKNSFIRVVENQRIKQIPVLLGSKQRGIVEILKGLYLGADLVERSSRFVGEGETVIIENGPKESLSENKDDTKKGSQK